MEDKITNTSSDPVHDTPTRPKKEKGLIRDVIETALLVVFVLAPIRLWIAQPFIVVGSSMYPTFSNGDYLIVDEISYRLEDPKRGEVIVFRPPDNPKDHYIKRIVGLPGETVVIEDDKVTIINDENPKGFVLQEPYTSSMRAGLKKVTLGSGQYFVMGDNRAVSSDSRAWGALDRDHISGRVLLRMFPIQKLGVWPGLYEKIQE